MPRITGIISAVIIQFFSYTVSEFSVSFASDNSVENKKRVAVVEFQVKGDLGVKDAGSIIAEWMIGSLLKTDKFNLKERVLLKKALEEQALESSGLVDEKTMAAEAGKLHAVEAIVTGSVIKWGDIISVTARVIDTKNGAILSGADVKTQDVNRIPEKIDELAEYMAGIRKELPKESLTPQNQWKIGSHALINWSRDIYWYPGTIKDIKGDLYFILFDDGDSEWADVSRIKPEDIKPGDRVFGNWKNKGKYYPGVVTQRNGLNIHIKYDDGDREETTISFIRVK